VADLRIAGDALQKVAWLLGFHGIHPQRL
jgi:hypothetical protein